MLIKGLLFFLHFIIIEINYAECSPLYSGLPSIFPRLSGTTRPAVTLERAIDAEVCALTKQYVGATWWLGLFFALVLIVLTGLLAGLTLAVMSVDLAKLRVLTRTGTAKRRYTGFPNLCCCSKKQN